jgi:hypothetical protein
MLKKLRRLLGLRPPLHGLESLLDKIKRGSITVKDGAEQIRDLAGQPHYPTWLHRFFRFLGGLMVVFGIGTGMYSVYFSIGMKETDGQVTEMRGTDLLAPTVEYAVNGERYTYKSKFSTSPPAYSVGDKVKMLYHPNNPQLAQINTFHDRWLLPLINSGFGIFFISVSLILSRIYPATSPS